MQLSFKKPKRDSQRSSPRSAAELREGERGVIARLELPDHVAIRLMELGFLPGSEVTAGRCAPGGDPRVFRIDGSEIALRREIARYLSLHPAP